MAQAIAFEWPAILAFFTPMPSLKHIHANQQNARRSTGPKTPEGRATSSRNALKHGLSARNILLPDEDQKSFDQLFASLCIEHQPAGANQEYFVRQLAIAQWRLDRLQRIETGLLASRLQKVREWEAKFGTGQGENSESRPNRDYEETTRQLGCAFFNDSNGVDAFTKLCRYEATIRRSFYKALDHLRRAKSEKKQKLQNKPISPH